MTVFNRKESIEKNSSPKRVLVIYGPRRVGKTTILRKYIDCQVDKKTFFGVGDDIKMRELFGSESRDAILDFARPYDLIAIDEAQDIKKIGLGIKMIIDEYPEKEIILTGSSSFNLSQEIGEPLTGRHFTMSLYPVAQSEFDVSKFELKNKLEEFLIYGAYPEVLLTDDKNQKRRILDELVSSYLFKDVLILDKIKSPDLLLDITKCLAFQVGSEVSMNEIAKNVKSDVKTVQRYIDILEKMFVIKKNRGFSRNLRNEISKKSKYYFLDNGIRNAVINQFNDISQRQDIGALWENFVFMELYKKDSIDRLFNTFYFWRTHLGNEIDIILESDGVLKPIECKWNMTTAKTPKLWSDSYGSQSEELKVINKNNYLDFFV
jgi:uncharacterized protein